MNEQKKKNNNVLITVIIVSAILIVAAILFVTISLANNQKNSEKKYTAAFITAEVVKKQNYDNLSEITSANISKYYDIPDGVVADSSMYISTRSDNFNEIACFRLSSQDRQEQLMKVISDYISEKTATYQNVNEKAYSIVSAAKTDVIYPYVFVAITSDNETAVSAFENVISDSTKEKNKNK